MSDGRVGRGARLRRRRPLGHHDRASARRARHRHRHRDGQARVRALDRRHATLDAREHAEIASRGPRRHAGGADVSIDALGTADLFQLDRVPAQARQAHPGRADARQHSRPAMPMDQVLSKELEIIGSHGMQAHRYPEMLEMIRTGSSAAGEAGRAHDHARRSGEGAAADRPRPPAWRHGHRLFLRAVHCTVADPQFG